MLCTLQYSIPLIISCHGQWFLYSLQDWISNIQAGVTVSQEVEWSPTNSVVGGSFSSSLSMTPNPQLLQVGQAPCSSVCMCEWLNEKQPCKALWVPIR